jgi:hypothetical protein
VQSAERYHLRPVESINELGMLKTRKNTKLVEKDGLLIILAKGALLTAAKTLKSATWLANYLKI